MRRPGVGDPSHLIYFASYVPSPFVFRTVESGALLLLEPGRATLVADEMLGPFLDEAFADERVAPVWYDGTHSAPYRRGQLVAIGARAAGEGPGAAGGRRAGGRPGGGGGGPPRDRPGLELVDIGPLIRPLRRSKDPDEIETLRRSMRAGEAAQAAALAEVRPGMTELDACLIVHRAAAESLGEPVIVYGDFASGPALRARQGRAADVADDRARRPAAARLLGGRLRLPGGFHQYVRRRRRADGPPARAVRGVPRCPARGRGPPEAGHGRPRR